MPASDARISPTAHYTSYVWFKNGMSHQALTSTLGHVLYRTLQPMNYAHQRLTRAAGLETMLLARHRVIDHLLAGAIESGQVRQVIEIASGLSPRGYRFARRYAAEGLVYLEGDLADMAAHKRGALAGAGLSGPNHHVVHLDALADGGPASLDAVGAAHLDPGKGTAIITEGLTGYIDRAALEGMWGRFARHLGRYPRGRYLADLVVDADAGGAGTRAFARVLGMFVRGRLHLHYPDAAAAERALLEAGFGAVRLSAPAAFAGEVAVPGADRDPLARIIDAEVVRR